MRQLSGLAAALAGAVWAAGALAAPVVDQQYVFSYPAASPPYASGGIAGSAPPFEYTHAQTFTVGLSGELAAVSLQFGQYNGTGGDFVFRILPTVSGIPALDFNDALASVTIPYASFPTFSFSAPTPATTIDFSALGLHVTAGDVLAIAVSATGGAQGAWDILFPGGYAEGSAYSSYGGSAWAPQVRPVGNDSLFADFAFTTYVDPSPSHVPEPASLAVLGTAVLTAGLALRSRRRG
ncbi:PEP-CTERM sorting domain-containing protein [Limobrevibacterium gyesilva]|uniref:PEP-CTERM sorting domain-containing protein n=1 Tax=Limobrevibacterium gyesilva TaxID=2991712 RepID=A0AA41YPP7_9PROT|nr:PEP-CTERM sorting domain-containing protein [Limobrevibacterium gyesilva]MCW3476610.1 PEP-CTERM sorting domain-containing protein [Limobrevibacterium gyesilva]